MCNVWYAEHTSFTIIQSLYFQFSASREKIIKLRKHKMQWAYSSAHYIYTYNIVWACVHEFSDR